MKTGIALALAGFAFALWLTGDPFLSVFMGPLLVGGVLMAITAVSLVVALDRHRTEDDEDGGAP